MAFTVERGDEEDRVTGDCQCDCKEICIAEIHSPSQMSEILKMYRWWGCVHRGLKAEGDFHTRFVV